MKCYRFAALSLLFSLLINHSFAQTADETQGCAAFTVSFTPPAGAASFFWEFGDGVTSVEENAQHIYSNPGNFEVIFRESMGGPQVGQSITINVYPKPEIDLTADPTGGCAPLQTTLTATITADPAINVFNYLWDFGDSQSDNGATLSTVGHNYTNPGNYDVALTIQTNFQTCNTIEQAADLVSASGPPGVGFLTNPSPAFSCTAPLTVNFINTSLNQGLDWSWDFGNGNVSTDLNPAPQVFDTEGNFTVTLIGTDLNGCSGTFTQVVSIGQPFASFVPSQDTVCLGALPIPMVNSSSDGTYAWTFDNGAFPSTSTQNNPLVQFNQPGITNITLVVTSPDGMCSATATGQVFVDDPDATFESIPTYSCDKDLIAQFVPVNTMGAQYIWTFDGGGTSNEMSPTHTYSNLDTTTHGVNGRLTFVTTLTLVSPAGCVAEFSVTDTIHQPNSLFFPSVTEGCAPLTVDFENRSENDFEIVSYNWDFGDGTTMLVNNDDPQTHTFTAPGEYEVVLSLTDELGCRDTSYVQTIFVGDALSPTFTLSQTQICPGDSITLQDITNSDLIDAWHFATDDNRSFHCYQEDVLTHVFESGTGLFDATLIVEYNGCFSEVTQTDVIEVQGPIAHIDYLVDCADPFNISFRDSSDDALSVLWEFGDLSDTTVNDPFHMYADTGAYQVYLTASNASTGCPDSKDSVTVHVQEIKATFDLDSFLCLGIEYDLDGSESIGLNADCHRGYTWSFSDPNDRPVTTQDSAIKHIFEMRDTNFITLVTTDINGCTDTIIDTVRVFGVYPELLAMPVPICLPSTVTFSSFGTTADTTIESYMWDFGDGGMSEDQNPTHTYTNPPTGNGYSVTLTVEDVIPCSSTGFVEVPVYTPVSVISASPSLNICVGDSITFSASDFTDQGSNLSWTWNFGNTMTSNNQTETVTYNQAGLYPVVLNYFENGTLCEGIPDTVMVSVQDYPAAGLTTSEDGNYPVCAPVTIQFNDASSSNHPLSYFWDLGDGTTSGSAAAANTYNRGEYTITHIVQTLNGCADTATQVINFIGPEGDLAIDQNVICYGDAITFTLVDTIDVGSWQIDYGDGVLSAPNESPATHTYNTVANGDSTIVQLLLDDVSGMCQVTVNIPIFFQSVDASLAGFIPTGCVNEAIAFNAVSTSATSYDWDFGDGSTASTQSTSHTYTDIGEFVVVLTVSNALGCIDFIQDTITIEEIPEISAMDLAGCYDEIANLTVTGDAGYNYSWSPAQFVTDPNAQNTTTNVVTAELPAQNFEFTVTASSQTSGCEASETILVSTVPELIFPDEYNPSVCPDQVLVIPIINPGGFYNYNWSAFPNTIDVSMICDTCNNPTFNVPADIDIDSFTITATPTVGLLGGGTCAEPFSFKVNVLANSVPNAFTPDNDGFNDYFDIPVRDAYNIKTFQIFNRWGQKVYDDDTPATGWDGNYNGNKSPSDVYIFIFETENDECVFRGNLTLLR